MYRVTQRKVFFWTASRDRNMQVTFSFKNGLMSWDNEIYDDISENYEKAMEEVETTTTIVREVTTPDFEGVDTNYYILKTQHPLNEADIRCANKNFRPLTLKREGDVLGLMQFLKTKSIKT